MAVFLKALCLWGPAGLFWLSMIYTPLFDFRTDEELQEEEEELKRAERFYDIEGCTQDEYAIEWKTKGEALAQVREKLLKSKRFMRILGGPDPFLEDDGGVKADHQVSWSPSLKKKGKQQQSLEALSQEVEFCDIVPPLSSSLFSDMNLGNGEELPDGQAVIMQLPGGRRRWEPRMVVSHYSGAIALVKLVLDHVEKEKDRDARWACTQLRADLIAGPGGEPVLEPICDLVGHIPHGVRYMRI